MLEREVFPKLQGATFDDRDPEERKNIEQHASSLFISIHCDRQLVRRSRHQLRRLLCKSRSLILEKTNAYGPNVCTHGFPLVKYGSYPFGTAKVFSALTVAMLIYHSHEVGLQFVASEC